MSYHLHSVTLVLIVQDRVPAIIYMFQAAKCQVEGRREQISGTISSLCYKKFQDSAMRDCMEGRYYNQLR